MNAKQAARLKRVEENKMQKELATNQEVALCRGDTINPNGRRNIYGLTDLTPFNAILMRD